MMASEEYRDQVVVVMGLGLFGGGVGVIRWLAEQGAKVRVTDLADREKLASSIDQLGSYDIEYFLGSHPEQILDGAALLVVSPAVDKFKSPFVQNAQSRGIPVTSEMNLFLDRCPARLIGITGSVGKSTTTAMIFDTLFSHVRSLQGSPAQVWLGGNIGGSLLSDLPRMGSQDYVVLEMSSYQLEDIQPLRKSPHIAVITSLMPQHLDRHGTFENYLQAKLNIVRFQSKTDRVFISEQAMGVLEEYSIQWPGAAVEVYSPVHELQGRLQVRGRHHLQNASAAIRVARLLGLTDDQIIPELVAFKGLPHRLECVRTYEGVTYYNDSKSTMPDATIAALEAFDEKLILMVGGYDKHVSFEKLSQAICPKARTVICLGECRAKIAAAIRRLSGSSATLPEIKSVTEFHGGVFLARRLAKPGEVVLFSPGCPSYDEFANFEQRGDRFKNIINNWV